MAMEGKVVKRKRSCRKRRVPLKEARSDDSDEDYVVSDAGGDVSDCLENDWFSLDGCASEDSLDDFIEEEEEDEIQRVRKFNRSTAKNGVRRENSSKTSRKRSRITCEEQLEEEEDDEEEEEGDGDDDEDDDKDEDFNYEDDEEFTPEEEDYSDEEEETMGGKKKNNGVKTGKKALRKKVSVTSSRGRKRSSRVSKKPLRKRRRKNERSRTKVQRGDVDGFIDNGSGIRINSRKNSRRVRRSLILEDSDSDCVSKSSDHEFTISEDERQQVREAMELCGSLKRNQRSASLQMKNEEDGVHGDLHQQRKPRGRKGKEKIEESKGRKGKEKVEDLKSELAKQVCGICLSEENKRRIRGVLSCCTHYFCFACIMEWSKVETRCPLCKQRFNRISKSARPTTSTESREMVIQVPERNQIYEPTEEELRSYIDPYETVICSECNEGGDDELMLLCDICDSPAHTYCVGLGYEVPEGNWYCIGCRPVAFASLNSQVQECPADSSPINFRREPSPINSIPIPSSPNFRREPSPVLHLREIIDLNLRSSPRTSFGQGFGHLSSSRFSSRNVEGASPISGGGAPTLSERRWIHRHIQSLLSIDRMMTPTTGRTNSSMRNLQIDQSREPATQHTRAQDETSQSHHTFFDERLSNNISPLMRNGDPFSIRISNSRTPEVQNSTMFANMPVDGITWPGLLVRPTLSNYEPIRQFCSISDIVTNGSLSPAIKEESSFYMVEEQLQSMVKSHLKNLSPDIDLGFNTFKDIARSSTHTILAACGLEHKKSEVCPMPPPPACPHIELMAGGQTSIVKGCCSSCFDSFVGDVVKRILEDTRMSSQWLRLGL